MYPGLNYNTQQLIIENLSGGIVIDSNESKLLKTQSPDMLNMYFDKNTLKKREGQKMLFYEEGIFSCSKEPFYNHFIYHAKDKIKAYDCNEKKVKTILGCVPRKKGTFFLYNGYIYYVGTGEYYKISYCEGEFKGERVEGFVPTVMINCDSNSVGDDNEPYNYLTGKFKLTYNTTTNINSINFSNVDADKNKGLTVKYGGIQLGNYTVDWEMKIIKFEDYFAEGHNLLEITFCGNSEKDDREKITNCKAVESFGGLSAGISEGTRVFFTGNNNFPNTFFYSGLKNPEYFPVTQFEILGDDNDPVVCIGKQYNGLVFFKKKSIYISYYSFENGEINFTVSRLNSGIGCDCPNTLETVDNQLVWLNSVFGVMTLSSTNIKDEKNVKCISSNINGKESVKALLTQENLCSSTGFVNRGKYYLVTGEYTYVLNISDNFYIGMNPEKMSWFLMDNIRANGYLYYNREVYITGDKGFSYFSNVLYDFDINTPVKSYVTTKAFDFNAPDCFKYIFDVALVLKSVNNSYFKLEAKDENGIIKTPWEYSVKKFVFSAFSFINFTFRGNLYSIPVKRKITRRKTKYLMLKFSNDKADSQMCISDIYINYSIERRTKYNGI